MFRPSRANSAGPSSEQKRAPPWASLGVPLASRTVKIGPCPFSPFPVSSCSILPGAIKTLRGTCRRITVHCFLRGLKLALPVTPVDPTATVWRGDPNLPVALQGVEILGTPVGHEPFIVHKLAQKTAAHSVLLDRIPAIENVQAAWLLLLFCAAAKANFLLRTVNLELTIDYAAHHDSRCWQYLCRILRAPDPNAKMIAAVPLSEGGLGLHNAVLIRSAAHWASWADCMHKNRNRHPSICRSILTGLSVEFPSVGLQSVRSCGRELQDVGFELPSWVDLAEGLRPNSAAVEDEPGMPRFGWQRVAAACLEVDFKTHRLLPTTASAERALMRSQAGPLASVPVVAFPTCSSPSLVANSSAPSFFVASTFPFPCPLATAGVAVAACSVAGILGKRGFPLENAAGRVCREAGARVRTNVMVRDMDLVPNDRIDNRRLEVVADGLPLFGGAQLATDTTLVSTFRRDGTSRPQADSIDGVALAAARRNKARTYPELSGGDGRARLVVLAAEVGGRWWATLLLGWTGLSATCCESLELTCGQSRLAKKKTFVLFGTRQGEVGTENPPGERPSRVLQTVEQSVVLSGSESVRFTAGTSR